MRSPLQTATWIPLWALGIAVYAAPIFAHHSIAGVYDTRRQMTIEATVAQFHFVNPHPILTVRIGDGGAGAQVWQLEMDNRRELTGIGMGEDTLKPGDRVVVAGNPSRNEAHRLYVRRLDRPADGFIYEQVGFSPRVNIRPE
jgi:hypothetical protein